MAVIPPVARRQKKRKKSCDVFDEITPKAEEPVVTRLGGTEIVNYCGPFPKAPPAPPCVHCQDPRKKLTFWCQDGRYRWHCFNCHKLTPPW